MPKVIDAGNGYLMLLDAVYFCGKRLGFLSEDGLDWGGDDAQKTELWAAQQRSNPVLDIETRAATNELTGKMIEMVPENCVPLLGGKVVDGGWLMPANSIRAEGEVKVLTGTGYTITINRASLRAAKLRGGLGGDKVMGIEFGLKQLAPLDGSSPGSIVPTQPFITANPTSLSFEKAGGSKSVDIEASGPFSVGAVPEGFSVEIINGRVTVIASDNSTEGERSGELEFILEADPEKKATVTLTQPNA